MAGQAEREQAQRWGVLPFPWPVWLWVGLSMLVRLLWYLLMAFVGSAIVGTLLAVVGPSATVSRWLLVVVALLVASLLLGELRHTLTERRRVHFWRAQVAGEYYSWRLPPFAFRGAYHRFASALGARVLAVLWLDRIRRLAWLHTPAHRWVVRAFGLRSRASDEDRMRWAQRWAAARELAAVPRYVGFLTMLFAIASLLLWRIGWTTVNEPVLAGYIAGLDATTLPYTVEEARNAAVSTYATWDYLWQIADMLPGFGIAEAAGVPRPEMFSGDVWHAGLIEGYQILVLAPAVPFVAIMLSDREQPIPEPAYGGAVERAVAHAIATRGEPVRFPLPVVLDDAAVLLTEQRIAPPMGRAEWNRDAVLRQLVHEQRSSPDIPAYV
ncbi:MAG TPA: hypothetical protein VES42_16855 [Pilimelia sp.]|nr:hypothetical protein [Pilimelia sp.]